MASKQKSFFDQKPSAWRTNRQQTFNNAHDNFAIPNKAVSPRSPLAPSLRTKARLGAFRFVGEEELATVAVNESPGMMDKEKENARSSSTIRDAQSQGKASLQGSQKSAKDACREYPRTPVGRVPLADLINTGADNEKSPMRSPIERVAWNHSPQSSDEPSSYMTPISRRGKKRARSSSPISSQKNTSTSKPIFDLQNLQASLKTPHVDPAFDLEKRYFSRIKHSTPSKPSASAAADFMHSSSPQTPALGSNESAKLRRTMSCGVQWPDTNKRRKVSKDKHVLGESSVLSTKKMGRDKQTVNLDSLLDQIQDDLDASTSILPRDAVGSPVPRPTGKRQHEPSQNAPRPESNVHTDNSRSTASPGGEVTAQEVCLESFEFDDDDFDLAMLNEADFVSGPSNMMHANVHQPEIGRHSKSMTGTAQAKNRALPNTGVYPETAAGSITYPNVEDQSSCTPDHNNLDTNIGHGLNVDDDEFGDDDDIFNDEFAADVEDVFKKYDKGPHKAACHAKSTTTNVTDDSNLEGRAEGPQRMKEGVFVEVSSDEEFDEGIDFEEIADEFERTTQGNGAVSSDMNTSLIQRYVITSLADSEYKTDKGATRQEKVLLVQEERTKMQKAVILRQSWLDSPCATKSYINVLGRFDNAGQCIIDDANNFLILHPDHLISATVVADSFTCTRRAVLQDRVKATSTANGPQVYGHILHEIFQEAMRANRWDTEWLSGTIEATATRYLESLHEIQVDKAQAIEHLTSKVSELQSWARLFVNARPKAEALVKDRNGMSVPMCVNKLLDVEEHVWSPRYGLKGNIDATVQVVMQDKDASRTLTVPFEIKTGRNNSSASHKAQTALYTLLLSDRYDVQIAYGILYYMETSEISRMPGIRHELLHMVKQRNALACFVRNRLELPPMLKDPRLCGKCYAQKPCFIMHKLVENGDGKTSGMDEKFDELVRHLEPIHQKFFKHWDGLLTKEEGDVLRFRRELWTMLSSEREKIGRCFGSLIIEHGSTDESKDNSKINRYTYTFTKSNIAPSFSFTDSQITTGEPIVISDEAGHYALANGYVTYLRKNRITVAVDRRLHNARIKSSNFDAERHQSFTGIMEVIEDSKGQQSTVQPVASQEPVLYRLDKDEFSNGMATVRNNLIRMMEHDLFGARALRRLVVEGAAPTYQPPTKETTASIIESQACLNVDQRNAIEKVMAAKDYALVLGMPGTGKTTTIAHIIRALTSQGKSVLLTSYTHTAVDNILLKIRDDGTSILRLGAISKIHPEVQGFADLASIPKTTVEELQRSYASQVVATTCLGVNHPIFNQRLFDYCIVDEASQITLPVCLGPIRMAKKFVLVGDHYQLPPLVQNKEAQQGGLDVSLFKLLSDKHPQSVVNLEHQYRMCEDIMSLSNVFIYNGRLKCGTPEVAAREIEIPNMAALKQHHHTPQTLTPTQTSFCPGPVAGTCWLRDIVDPSTHVTFLNTDPLLPASREIAKGSRITNPLEVSITTQIVETLITIGIPATEIGVITLYRSQLASIRQSLRHRSGLSTGRPAAPDDAKNDPTSAVEMHTTDKFQGRDKEVVVLSLVRSNETNNIGELLQDWRRVNVALTRARTKLIIVGSFGTISKGNELLGKLSGMIDQRGWRLDLKEKALDGHLFDDWLTQTSVASVPSKVSQSPKVSKSRKVEKGRVPEKAGKVDARQLLKSRPVMRDIVNEVMG